MPLTAPERPALLGTTAEAFGASLNGSLKIASALSLTTFDYAILKIVIGRDEALQPPSDAAARFLVQDPERCVLQLPAVRSGNPPTSYWGWANWISEDAAGRRLVIRVQVGPAATTVLRLMYVIERGQLIVERAIQRVDRTVVLAPVRYTRAASGK